MKNWSVDETYLKQNPEKYALWKLEQQLSYGLDDGEKINQQELQQAWPKLKNRLDPKRRDFVDFILWA
jgi:hypothetical protein